MSWQEWQNAWDRIILPGLGSTFYMVLIATLLSSVIGLLLAIILTVTGKNGLHPNRLVYGILDFIVNILRSFPFIILAVAIIPLSRILVGTSIGEVAALVPLTLVGSPLMARLFEGSFATVDKDLIAAIRSFGASDLQIILKIIIPEALPSLVLNVTLAMISILGCTAMAGAVGAGGLGAVAITYGYQDFNDIIMYGTVIILVVIVQIIQFIGNAVHKALVR